ncbi:hypothetical protein [Pseudovibrio sp. POLY-S9]|uniref:hypothetical protein n=1 Tax=Pseudovibrio sp. POLY-S9 TaxID=1576596 RepID=UPI000B22B2D4|nr:hypothetical protein [Pseudovibrio sp. POLY-S9]
MPEEFESYSEAQQHQLNEWVQGRPWHNPFSPDGVKGEGECCPDFSCCSSGQIWSMEMRKDFAEAGDKKRQAMLAAGLFGLFKDNGFEVASSDALMPPPEEGLAPTGVDLDTVEILSFCARVGQTVASEVAMIFGPSGLDGFDPVLWASAGEIVPFQKDDTGEAAVIALTSYVLDRDDRGSPASGETLFRKAAELLIHKLDCSRWDEQPTWLKFAYNRFARAISEIGSELKAIKQFQAAKAPPIDPIVLSVSESIFEQEDDIGARDPELLAALSVAQKVSSPSAEPEKILKPESEETSQANEVMSVGERPVAVS